MTVTQLGKNTLASEELRGFVERIEAIEAQKKELSGDAKFVMAEARQKGFAPKAIRYVIKVRAQEPHDRAESEALRDIYLHAMGVDQEPPLFRHVGLMDVDIHARESVVAALEKFVPADGEIIVKVGKSAERLWRDKDGAVHSEAVVDKPRPAAPTADAPSGAQRPDVAPVSAGRGGRL